MYDFKIHFTPVKPTTSLVCIKAVYVSGICIVAKNSKFGDFYFSKYIKSIQGKFKHVCGSVRYPYLNTQGKKVILQITNFPVYPSLDNIYQNSLGEIGLEFLQHITIKDVKHV
jgi:hypothetical protein